MTFASDRLSENQQHIAQQATQSVTAEQPKSQSRFVFDPAQIMCRLRQGIIGQAAAMGEIENLLQVVKADFNDPHRPLAVTLMLGPTGVGKTETVRLISQAIYGNPDAFCRIDMNTLAQEHYSAALTGAPPGYVGSKEGNSLLNIAAIQGSYSKPGIILFDEIEKASTEVIRALLNVLDTGYLRLTAGTKEIDFRNCMIFMTSNIGAKSSQKRMQQLSQLPPWLQHVAAKCKLDAQRITQQALERKFDPEFLNRIERILYYQAVEQQDVQPILTVLLEQLNQRLAKQQRRVDLSDRARQYLAKQYDSQYGARGLKRLIRTQIEPLLAHHLHEQPSMRYFEIDVINHQLQMINNSAEI